VQIGTQKRGGYLPGGGGRRWWWCGSPSMTSGARPREAEVDAGVAQLVEAVDSPLQSPPFGRASQTEQHPEPWALIGSINMAVSTNVNLHADWRRLSAGLRTKRALSVSRLPALDVTPVTSRPSCRVLCRPTTSPPPLLSPPANRALVLYCYSSESRISFFFIGPAYLPPASHLHVPTATLASADHRTTHAPRSLSTAARTSPLPCCFQSTRTSLPGCRARRAPRPPARSLPACRKGWEFKTPQYTLKLQRNSAFVLHCPIINHRPVSRAPLSAGAGAPCRAPLQRTVQAVYCTPRQDARGCPRPNRRRQHGTAARGGRCDDMIGSRSHATFGRPAAAGGLARNRPKRSA